MSLVRMPKPKKFDVSPEGADAIHDLLWDRYKLEVIKKKR